MLDLCVFYMCSSAWSNMLQVLVVSPPTGISTKRSSSGKKYTHISITAAPRIVVCDVLFVHEWVDQITHIINNHLQIIIQR